MLEEKKFENDENCLDAKTNIKDFFDQKLIFNLNIFQKKFLIANYFLSRNTG